MYVFLYFADGNIWYTSLDVMTKLSITSSKRVTLLIQNMNVVVEYEILIGKTLIYFHLMILQVIIINVKLSETRFWN